MSGKIKAFIMDVDGTLTDGKIYMGENGEIMKAFNVKDGYGIQMLKKHNIIPIIITGRYSKITTERCKELGITEIYQSVKNKVDILKIISDKYKITYDEMAYIGDDLNDVDIIRMVKFGCCVDDGVQEAKNAAKYITKAKGGEGSVREAINLVLNDNIVNE